MFAVGAAAQLAFCELPQIFIRASPLRDKHDSGWPVRSYHRPHPSVYEPDYYDALRPAAEPTGLTEPPAPVRVPNLRIPLNKLIGGQPIPTLRQLPPLRPVPTLTRSPPAFKMASPEEMAADDEMIIRMLLEE